MEQTEQPDGHPELPSEQQAASEQPLDEAELRPLSFKDGLNFGLGFWSAGAIFYLVLGIITIGLLFFLSVVGCWFLSTLIPGTYY